MPLAHRPTCGPSDPACSSARVRVQTLRGRVESVVRGRGASGDVTEYKGRMCLAVPGDAGAVAARKGLVLGSSVAGGVVYFEPQVRWHAWMTLDPPQLLCPHMHPSASHARRRPCRGTTSW